jgi:hypothetical protein
MRVEEIKTAIENLRDILAAGGAKSAEADLSRLIELLAAQGDKDLDQYVNEVRGILEPKPECVDSFVGRLKSAREDEGLFKAALADIAKAKLIKKPEAVEIAKRYGVIRIDQKSKASVIASIEKYFYWMLYQRDAGAMAQRATPW